MKVESPARNGGAFLKLKFNYLPSKRENMTRLTLYKIALFLSIALVVRGLCLKIMYISAAQILIPLGLFYTLVYTIIALYEVYQSDRITLDEKIMWAAGFITVGSIAGLLYLFMGRQRILREFKILNQQPE